MIGRVGKGLMHRRRFKIAMLRELPDLYTFDLWYRKLRFDRRSANLLRTLADDLARRGLLLVDSTTYLPEHLATEGDLGARAATTDELGDVEFGWSLLSRVSELHIGQSLAVRQRDVICVEAVEGTDRMITRAGELCPRGGWTLLKTAAPDHDMRTDVPTIGVRTVEQAAAVEAETAALKRALADERELLREDLDKSEARLAAQVDAEIHLRGVVAELRGQLRDRGDVVVADEEAWERKLAEKSKALDYVEAELLGLTEIYERKERRLRAEFDAERAALKADLAARDQRRPLAPVAPPEATPPPPPASAPPRKPPPPPEDTAHLVPY